MVRHGSDEEVQRVLGLRHQTREEAAEATAQSIEAVAWFREERAVKKGLSKATLDKDDRLLLNLFTTPVVDDDRLGIRRPLTLAELLWPGYGRHLVGALARALVHDLGLVTVAHDHLRTLRVFSRFICDGAWVLPSGVNLREVWGPLVCPIADGEYPRRAPHTLVELPLIEEMERIFTATIDWAAATPTHKAASQRTASSFIGSFESGQRGCEERWLTLGHQHHNPAKDHYELQNPVSVVSAKGGDPRPVRYEPFGLDYTNYYLRRWRPELPDNGEGRIYPSERGGEWDSGAFAKSSGRLIAHLKERGLLHERFTFHATRKTYATHFIERGGDLGQLQHQCGWKNTGMLATYWLPTAKAIAAQKRGFIEARTGRGN